MSVRIYQLARQLNLENKELMEILRKQGLDVKSPSSTIPNIYAENFIKEYQANHLAKTESKEPANQAQAAVQSTEKALKPSPVAPAVRPVPAPVKKDLAHVPGASFVKSAADVMAEKQRLLDEKRATVVMPTPKAKELNNTNNAPVPAPRFMMAPKVAKMPLIGFKKPLAPREAESQVVSEFEQKHNETKTLVIKPPVIVREFSTLLNIKPFRLISELMEMGIFASMNQTIDEEVARKVALKYGIEVEFKHRSTTPVATPVKELTQEEKQAQENKNLKPRPPIVCILGHVDHGKTTLLDFIRKSNVAAKESGGITQHVGAYQIDYEGKKITFLDTPGHAAFSKIRQRGATVTDIAVLVVAADDGFMPQTDEALKFAQKENVPVVVAINKIDAKGANVDRVKQQMQKRGLTPEDWGGDTLCVGISALNGTHVPDLLEAILLQAEMMELKANPQATAEGVVIESKIDVGKGPIATVIVNKGTLKTGDALVCDDCSCKVRALLTENEARLKEAGPATPVQVVGWSNDPKAGANFRVVKNEKEAKRIAEDFARQLKRDASATEKKLTTVDELMAAIETRQQKVLKVIIRTDVHGSLEALVDCLSAIKSDKVSLEIIDAEVGPITLNDVHLANASHATLVGFNTRLETGVVPAAKHDQVKILQHDIIYELIQRVTDEMRELLDPEWVENSLGTAEVRQVFPLAKGQVAGCMVIAGRVVRDASARLVRKGKTIVETKIEMLKHFKEDLVEVKSGYECGILLCNAPSEYKVGDMIECFEMIAKLPNL